MEINLIGSDDVHNYILLTIQNLIHHVTINAEFSK